MTEAEIKKALECCILSECENCPHDEETACKENLNQEILDLINRQQEMIDGLIAGQETLQKALAEKNAEIERLNGCVKSEDEVRAIAKATIQAGIGIIKAEAIKDFAERLKEESSCCVDTQNGRELYETKSYSISAIKLDNLVKEMVGDAE